VYWIFVIYLTASLVTFGAYGVDKRRATLGRRRIKERTLHWLELGCGWPGGFVGQAVFRHKRSKASYMMVFWGIVVLHGLAWGIWWGWHLRGRW
jgi:uncharacterized membrane protein YsdA (DUF1294 family)